VSAVQAWLAGYITWTLATLLLGTVVIMGYLTFNTLFLIWLERKVSGHIQRRYGPMEVGPHGALQTVADMLKLLGKQLLTPVAVDRFVYGLAPLLIFLPTLCVASLIPVSGAEAFARCLKNCDASTAEAFSEMLGPAIRDLVAARMQAMLITGDSNESELIILSAVNALALKGLILPLADVKQVK